MTSEPAPDGEVRRLTADEPELYRAIRLRALRTDPAVFSSDLARESSYPDAHWADRLSQPNVAVFGVFRGGRIVGMTGVIISSDDPTCAVLWGSWLDPSVRGEGLSRPMYEARIAWARSQPGVTRILVSHRRSNTASMRANRRYGFERTSVAERVWPDGTTEDEVCYELRLGGVGQGRS